MEVHWEGTEDGVPTLICRRPKSCPIEATEMAGTRWARRGWSDAALTHTASKGSEKERVGMRMVEWKSNVRVGDTHKYRQRARAMVIVVSDTRGAVLRVGGGKGR